MNVTRLVAAAILLLPFSAPAQTQSTRTPVLVELFTSEGCSSCPPADALLTALVHNQPVPGAEIIALGEHVDYWDSSGWRDRFSSHQFTLRQNQYSTRFHLNDVFTPQMVVQGSTQFVGSDGPSATRAISHAASAKTLLLTLAETKTASGHLSGTVSLAPANPSRAGGDLYAALVSPVETTDVRSGENGGRTLHHVGVVRSLTRIGDLQALRRAPVPYSLPLTAQNGPMRLVIFVQGEDTGAILGAISAAVPDSPRDSIASASPGR